MSRVTVVAPGEQIMYASGAPAGGYVDGAYVTENYVGPISIVLGCVLLGPILCPFVFLCPVRATSRPRRARFDARESMKTVSRDVD